MPKAIRHAARDIARFMLLLLSVRSKYKLQSQLQLPRRSERRCDSAGAAHCPGTGEHRTLAWNRKIRMVERVEHFGAELKIESLAQAEPLIQRHVDHRQSGSDQRVAAQIAV